MLERSEVTGDAPDVDSVDGDLAVIRLIETQDQVQQRALARSARPDDRDALADHELQGQPIQHRLVGALIGEGDAVERDVVGDARQVGRARPVGAGRRLIEHFLHMPGSSRGLDRQRNEVHDVGDVVGHLPERTLEGDERADGDLAVGGEIGANAQHAEVQQQDRDGDGALDHGREEACRPQRPPRVVVAQPEPAQCAALQAERLHHHLRSDILLDDTEDRRLVELLVVVGAHRLRGEDARPDQRDRKDQQRNARELPVQVQHQDDAGDHLEQRQQRAGRQIFHSTFIGRDVNGEARQDLAALGTREIRRRQVLHVLEQLLAHVGDHRGAEPRVRSARKTPQRSR